LDKSIINNRPYKDKENAESQIKKFNRILIKNFSELIKNYFSKMYFWQLFF